MVSWEASGGKLGAASFLIFVAISGKWKVYCKIVSAGKKRDKMNKDLFTHLEFHLSNTLADRLREQAWAAKERERHAILKTRQMERESRKEEIKQELETIIELCQAASKQGGFDLIVFPADAGYSNHTVYQSKNQHFLIEDLESQGLKTELVQIFDDYEPALRIFWDI